MAFNPIGIDLSGIDLSGIDKLTPGAIEQSTQTALGNVAFGDKSSDPNTLRPQDIEALIQSRSPEALGLIGQSSGEALRLAELAAGEQRAPLEQFAGLEAFEEQNRLLGLSGQEAQTQAIAGIPVSGFNRELNRRQRAQQQRQAFAGGDVSGASLLGQQQLAAGQQADIIQGRLAELDPLVSTARGVRSTLSGIDEATRARQANLLSGRGVQLANIRMGATAPLIESTLQRAELSGLRGIASAQQQAQQQNQLASLAGQAFQSQPVQQGFTNAIQLGGFDRAGFGTDQFGFTATQDPFADTF